MTPPRELTLQLMRSENPGKAHAFDGMPQAYTSIDMYGQSGHGLFPWDRMEALKVALKQPRMSEADQSRIGGLLREFLLDALKEQGGWGLYEKELFQAEGAQAPLLLRLRFNSVELFTLPWPLAQLSGQRRLGALKHCVITQEWVGEPRFPSPGCEPGRVLFAWSDAGGAVGGPQHIEALREACPDFDSRVVVCPELSLEALRKCLNRATEEGNPFRVLHILCHGTQLADETYGLIGSDPSRPSRPLPIGMNGLSNLLGQEHASQLHAVVLSACHGGHPGDVGSMFGGVALHLHKLGIPTVIASLLPLSVSGSVALTRAFYRTRCQLKRPLHEAYQAALAALPADSLDWASLQFLVSSPRQPEVPVEPRRVMFSEKEALPEAFSGDISLAYELNYNVAPAAVRRALAGSSRDVLVLQPLDKVGDALPASSSDWRQALRRADALAESLGTKAARVHLFGRAPLPLMFHLGWRLNRMGLKAYQPRRMGSDEWDCFYDSGSAVPLPTEPFFKQESWPTPEACREAGGRLALSVEVTLSVTDEDMARWLGHERPPVLLRLVAAREPSQTALGGPDDAARALDEFLSCLNHIREKLPQVQEIWLAMACPASLAAALGRAYNPKSQPRLRLFNFRKGPEGYVELPWSPYEAPKKRRR
ncbi:SAVED domain-containing protein [Corallococcus exiguus]|uniref:SAVED domain-containing protein n=1 Tax=Corallococcus exiguus TaxID=83462 RepID=UPI0020163974|nr:SAVED domain-containing protein [Corallococcus exiguus]